MTETEFYQALGRMTREQGWSLESVSGLALGFIASNKARRAQFIRLLRRVQRQESDSH